MRLSYQGLQDAQAWEKIGVVLPKYDWRKICAVASPATNPDVNDILAFLLSSCEYSLVPWQLSFSSFSFSVKLVPLSHLLC